MPARAIVPVVLVSLLAVSGLSASAAPPGAAPAASPAEAQAFIERAEARLLELWIKAERADWVQSNFITPDTEILAAEAQQAVIAATMELAAEATRFDGLDLPPELERKMRLLKTSLSLVAPREPAVQAELTRLATSLESMYGTGEWCRTADDCLDLTELTRVMAESRDPRELLEAWRGWHAIAPPMRPLYERFVELANSGARELAFSDLGELWRSKYDMPAEAFSAEVERLWTQVRPLYQALHCHVRAKLAERYGSDVVPPNGPIPAHLLGNMWAQAWSNVYDIVGPADAGPGYDLTKLLRDKNVDAREMVRYGERFFSSLGFEPLPESFWERSLFSKPADREVVCHASAWNVDWVDDLRIKMCIDITAEDFITVHHELGHNYYQRAYNDLDPLYRDSAHDGFHEGIGDAVALSITPDYLVRVGLLGAAPGVEGDIGFLLNQALDKVAFLPFGLLIDQWRWRVFSGDITAEHYNAAWWELRERYQGVAAPLARSEADFDPGAKYHVPANVPYTRYFLAHILQFQFHRALCDAAGFDGPLHRCSIYGNAAAGERLRAMLAMGASEPWPDALEALTGSRQMDATAILDYFAPLAAWLDEQNRGRTCGF
jgi:peptidyl-dipeptidase A